MSRVFGSMLVCVSFLIGTVEAGITFKQLVKTTGDEAEVGGDSSTRVWVQDGAVRMELLEGSEGSMTGMMEKGSWILMKGDEVYIVSPDQKAFSRVDSVAMEQAMGSVSGMMHDTGMEMKLENPAIEKLLEEDGGRIAGFPARHYRFRKSYTQSIKVPGSGTISTDYVITEDIWTTTALEVTVDLNGLRFFSGSSVEGEMMKLEEVAMSEVAGFPLRRIEKTEAKARGKGMMAKIMGHMGGDKGGTITTEAVDIRQEEIPASMFEIPAGYIERDLMQRGPAMPNLNEIEN